MSRIHDMGGRFGDGPIPEKDDSVVFHTNWHAHAMATTVACGSLGAWNIDAGRHARESLRPKDYASFSYYEKWMAGLADMLVAQNLLTEDDLVRAGKLADGSAVPKPAAGIAKKALRVDDVLTSQRKITPYTRPASAAAAFKLGDKIRTAKDNPNHRKAGGHTRLPAYAMGRIGTIVLCHGSHVLPDSNAHFMGEAPEPLYAVEFSAQELWGRDAEDQGDGMVLDLWQSYLEKVTP